MSAATDQVSLDPSTVAPSPTAHDEIDAPSLGGDDGGGHHGQASTRRNMAQACFSDGLHSIFAFLTLRDFLIASRCCRNWLAAGSSQPPFRPSSTVYATLDQMRAIAHSRVARRIDCICVIRCLPRDVSSVFSVSCQLPHLANLALIADIAVLDPTRSGTSDSDPADEEHTPLQMPHTLRELKVRFFFGRICPISWSPVDSLLSRLCHPASPPLTGLRVTISADPSLQFATQIPADTLSRVLALKDSLTELTLESWCPQFVDEGDTSQDEAFGRTETRPARWTQEHIDVFRQLTQLEKLDPFNGRWSDSELLMLCADPAPAHLRDFPLIAPPATAAAGEALARLPITKIDFQYSREVEYLLFLRRMPTLEIVSLTNVWCGATPADMESLVAALAECTRLTELSMPPPTTNAHLCRLLPSLPRLRLLDVDCYQLWSHEGDRFEFGGFSFASTVPHLAHTLEDLCLLVNRDAESIPLSEVCHFHVLRNLRFLLVAMNVAAAVPQDECDQASGEVNEQSDTFRRDLWPHIRRKAAQLELHRQEE